jgi:ParB family chromosome partitioning protein
VASKDKGSGSANTISDLVLPRGTHGNGPVAIKGETLIEAELDKIDLNPDQPRQWVDQEKIAELAASIETRGTRQPDSPILLRPAPGGQRFVLVTGERRWRAKQLLRERASESEKPLWSTIKALLREDIDDEKSAFIALDENLQREDLSPVEEGAAYVRLMERYSAKSIRELSARINKPEKRVQQMIRLHRAPQFLRDAVVKGALVPVNDDPVSEDGKPKQIRRKLEFKTAAEFLKLYDHLTGKDPRVRESPKAREKIEERVAGWVDRALTDGWSVRRVEEHCAALKDGKRTAESEGTPRAEPAAFQVTADRFVVYRSRASVLEVDARRKMLVQLAEVLGLGNVNFS